MARVISCNEVKGFITGVLCKLGIDKKQAEVVADVLLEADLRGIESHGIARLPIYVKRIKKGLINTRPNLKIISESGSMALIDADNALGPVAAKFAMEKCIEKARTADIAIVGVRNTNHFGICAYYAMLPLQYDMIGLAATNTSPLMAPFGGCEPLLGTNPFSLAIPANSKFPLVLDMATSLVPRGKIEVYKRKGQRIPLGWAIDKNGMPTDNPETALMGTLLPVGGPKGYSMALVIDILAGLMTGSAYGSDVGSLFGNFEKTQRIGNIMIVINVEKFMPVSLFKTRIDDYIINIKNSRKGKNTLEIFLPGEIEHKKMVKKRIEGISISAAVLHELKSLFPLSKAEIL